MSVCEKCWKEAFKMRWNGLSQEENYIHLLNERKDHPCTPEEQAGQYWDPQFKRDVRNMLVVKKGDTFTYEEV